MSEPTQKAKNQVDFRDKHSCVRCGVSLESVAGSRHHRKPRAVGKHDVRNLILLCGSGTTGCHGWAHSHPKNAHAAGYIIPGNNRALPEDIPVLVHAPGVESHQSHVWVLLTADGQQVRINNGPAQELLTAFGLVS